MLGLGIWEIAIILVTALIVLGPEKLPQTARQLARMLGELRRVSDEVRRNFDDVIAEPVDAKRPDAPRPLPAGAQAAHSEAAPPAGQVRTVAQSAAPDVAHAARAGAEVACSGAHRTKNEVEAQAQVASKGASV